MASHFLPRAGWPKDLEHLLEAIDLPLGLGQVFLEALLELGAFRPLHHFRRRLEDALRESGGPQVEAPITSGFGTKLIAHMTEIAPQGHVSLAYPPEGVVWTIDAPLDCITPETGEEIRWSAHAEDLHPPS